MYDSSGSIPYGLLASTPTSFGDFDACMSIANGSQYCWLTLHSKQNFTNDLQLLTDWERAVVVNWKKVDRQLPIAIGLCLPQICTEQDVDLILKKCTYNLICLWFNVLNQYDFSAYPIAENLNTHLKYCQSQASDGALEDPRWVVLYDTFNPVELSLWLLIFFNFFPGKTVFSF